MRSFTRNGQAFGERVPTMMLVKPENALTGQISWVEYPSQIGVPAFYKKLRFWRNTSVANLSAGQTAFSGLTHLVTSGIMNNQRMRHPIHRTNYDVQQDGK